MNTPTRNIINAWEAMFNSANKWNGEYEAAREQYRAAIESAWPEIGEEVCAPHPLSGGEM